jgi:LacI family transcriptional regulator
MLRRFAERGVPVPGQVSVTGCDDIFGADFCSPPLTTITAPTRRIGREATSMLLARLTNAGTRVRTVELPVFLTIRGSTGQAPA